MSKRTYYIATGHMSIPFTSMREMFAYVAHELRARPDRSVEVWVEHEEKEEKRDGA
jgi:hypothetical protein